MPRKVPGAQIKRSLSLLPMLALLLLFAQAQQASASSYANVFLDEPFVSAATASDNQQDIAICASATLWA